MKRLLTVFWWTAAPLVGQCVMCFRTAEAQQSARSHVLNIGILLLGVPPFLILAGFCFLFYKKNAVTGEVFPEAVESGPAEDPQPTSR